MKPSFVQHNRFMALKWYELATIQFLVISFFPISIAVLLFMVGKALTRELIEALVKDWVLTVIFIVIFMLVALLGVAWAFISWLG